MTFLTKLPFGLENTWVFAMIYLLATLIIMLSFPNHFKKRLLTVPKISSLVKKVLFIIGIAIFSRGLFIYSISVTAAMLNFAKTERDKPVVNGIYRLSRHPIK